MTQKAKLIVFTDDDKEFWLDIVDGKLDFGGNIETTESAEIFLKELGNIIAVRILENAKTTYRIEES
jgi:hypothetical protein